MPDGAQDFAYTTTGTGTLAASPSMTTAQRRPHGDILNTKVFNNLAPGAYSVTETLPVTGYDLTNLVCTRPAPAPATRRTSATGVSTITLGPGERGDLHLHEHPARLDHDHQEHQSRRGPGLRLHDDRHRPHRASPSMTTASTTASTATSSTRRSSTTSPPAPTASTETLPVTGYDLTNLSATRPAPAPATRRTSATGVSTITLGPGERGHLHLHEHPARLDHDHQGHQCPTGPRTSPTRRPAPARLAASPSMTTASTARLHGDIRNTQSSTASPTGAYSVTETLPVAGYDLTNLVCTGRHRHQRRGATSATGVVDHRPSTPASAVTCTYTNTQRGSITIIKDTNARRRPRTSPTRRPAPASRASPSMTTGSTTASTATSSTRRSSTTSPPAPTASTETLPVTGYDLTNLVCTRPAPAPATRRTSAPASSTITLGPAGR